MSTKDTGGPAFASGAILKARSRPGDAGSEFIVTAREEPANPGMTLRQYAAIKLKVPDSGTDWLDAMITKSLRDDFAAKSLQGICASGPSSNMIDAAIAKESYSIADAMLEARAK